MVSSEEVNGSVGSVASVGSTVVVNNIIVHVALLVEIFVISRVTVGKFIGVSGNTVQQGLVVLRAFKATLKLEAEGSSYDK